MGGLGRVDLGVSTLWQGALDVTKMLLLLGSENLSFRYRRLDDVLLLILIFSAVLLIAQWRAPSSEEGSSSYRAHVAVLSAIFTYCVYLYGLVLSGTRVIPLLHEHLLDGLTLATIVGFLIDYLRPTAHPQWRSEKLRGKTAFAFALGGGFIFGVIAWAASFTANGERGTVYAVSVAVALGAILSVGLYVAGYVNTGRSVPYTLQSILRGSPPDSESMRPSGAWMVLVGSICVGAGTAQAWVNESGGSYPLSFNAFQLGDQGSTTWVGPLLVFLALVGALGAVARLRRTTRLPRLQRLPIMLGIAITIVAVATSPRRPDGLSPAVSWYQGGGNDFCVFGGTVIFIGALVLVRREKKRKKTSEPLHDVSALVAFANSSRL